MNDNKFFVGKEIGHALDGKSHLRHSVQHHDVEQDDHGEVQVVCCFNVWHIQVGVVGRCQEHEKDDFDHVGVFFTAQLRFLELAHFSGKVFQLLGAEQNMLILTLLDDLIKFLIVELGSLLEHGQSEGGLHIAPIEEPVVQEGNRVWRRYNRSIKCLVFSYPPHTRLVC